MKVSVPRHWNKDVALADLSSAFPLMAGFLVRPVGLPSQDAIHAEVIHRDRGASFYKEVIDLPAPVGDELPLVLSHLSERWLGTLVATPRGHAVLVRFRAGHRGPDGYVSVVDGPGLDGAAVSRRVMELLKQAELSPFERASLLNGWSGG